MAAQRLGRPASQQPRANRRLGRPTFLAVTLVLLAGIGTANAAELIPGPVPARVVRVIDGDTLTVEATIWLGQRLTVNARVRGIDTPELHGACEREKAMAEAARSALARMTEAGAVRLTNIANGKYAGRVLADVATDDGTDVAAYMLATGLARPYDGSARAGWCDLANLGG
jgi:endonuclease YncB( thermonuclease family)